jgi:hypothetical protein
MAKAKKTPKAFLTELAKDPQKLAEFIRDPEGAMKNAGIKSKDHVHIKNAIAKHVHDKLTAFPEAFTVLK